MAVIFLVVGLVLIFAAFALLVDRTERRHNHPAARYMAGVQAAQQPLDPRDVELWGRQIMAADTDTLIREATR